MKKITKQILFLALSLSAFTLVSCDDEYDNLNDDATGESTLQVSTGVVGTINLTGFSNSQTVAEADNVYTYTVTLNSPQSVDVYVDVIVTASNNAVVGEDFDYSNKVIIPAYTLVGKGEIDLINNCDNTSNSSFTLQIGTQTTSNASVTPSTVTFNVTNFVGTDLELALSNDFLVVVEGVEYTSCQFGYDADYLVFDADFNVMDYVFTANCTEFITMSTEDYADGTYFIAENIYADGGLSNLEGIDEFPIPVEMVYDRCGSDLKGTHVEQTATSSTGPDNSAIYLVATVVVSNGVFTLYDAADVEFASGKSANKSKIQAAIALGRASRN